MTYTKRAVEVGLAAVIAVLLWSGEARATGPMYYLYDGAGNRLAAIDPSNLSTVTTPPAIIVAFAGATAPDGYLLCNGQAVSRTTYAALFAAIGTTYGTGNGSTTFNVPDLRGEFLRGLDAGRGVDTGRTLGSAQTDAMQGHRHQTISNGTSGNLQWGSGAAIRGENGASYANGTGAYAGDPTTDGTNGSPRTASETRPRNVALNFIIKT